MKYTREDKNHNIAFVSSDIPLGQGYVKVKEFPIKEAIKAPMIIKSLSLGGNSNKLNDFEKRLKILEDKVKNLTESKL